MDRRTLLRRAGALSLAAAAGCTGATHSPAPLVVASRSFHFTDGETGNASAAGSAGSSHPVVTTTVSNPTDRAHAATLVFAPEINGKTRTRTTAIELGAHRTHVFETTYTDVPRSSIQLTVHSHLENVR